MWIEYFTLGVSMFPSNSECLDPNSASLIRYHKLTYYWIDIILFGLWNVDEDPGLRIESFAVINLRVVSTNKKVLYVLSRCKPTKNLLLYIDVQEIFYTKDEFTTYPFITEPT
jgi:hypothetical protein